MNVVLALSALAAVTGLGWLTALYLNHDPRTCSECKRRRADRPTMHPTQGSRCPSCNAEVWDANAHARYCAESIARGDQ